MARARITYGIALAVLVALIIMTIIVFFPGKQERTDQPSTPTPTTNATIQTFNYNDEYFNTLYRSGRAMMVISINEGQLDTWDLRVIRVEGEYIVDGKGVVNPLGMLEGSVNLLDRVLTIGLSEGAEWLPPVVVTGSTVTGQPAIQAPSVRDLQLGYTVPQQGGVQLYIFTADLPPALRLLTGYSDLVAA